MALNTKHTRTHNLTVRTWIYDLYAKSVLHIYGSIGQVFSLRFAFVLSGERVARGTKSVSTIRRQRVNSQLLNRSPRCAQQISLFYMSDCRWNRIRRWVTIALLPVSRSWYIWLRFWNFLHSALKAYFILLYLSLR